jgi:hypothetical protein
MVNIKYRYANGLHYEGSSTFDEGLCRMPFDLEGKVILGQFNHDDKQPSIKGELYLESEFQKGEIEIKTELNNKQNLLVTYDNLRFESIAEFKEYLRNKYGGVSEYKNSFLSKPENELNRQLNKFQFSMVQKQPKLNGFQLYQYEDGSFYYGTFKNDYIFCHKDELPKMYNINTKLQRQIPFCFKGTLINNMKEGFGKEYYSDMSYYEGFFKNNKKEGKGKVLDFEKGYLYLGQFKDDKRHGQGVLIEFQS